MQTATRALTIALVAAPLMAGCATKGYVREQVNALRVQQDSALLAERMERMAADSTLRVDLDQLRQDLAALRTEFGAKITALEEGVQFAFPVNFAFDDAAVRPEDQAALDRFVNVVGRHYQGSVITVEGFADPAGSAAYNRRLSEARAQNVRQYLLERGLPAEQVKAVGYGENRQVVPGAARDEPGAEQNRRVVFVVESRGPATEAVALTKANDGDL